MLNNKKEEIKMIINFCTSKLKSHNKLEYNRYNVNIKWYYVKF